MDTDRHVSPPSVVTSLPGTNRKTLPLNPMPSKYSTSSTKFKELNYDRYSSFRSCSSNWVMKNGRPDLTVQNPHNFVSNQLISYHVNDPYGFLYEVYPGGVPNSVQAILAPGVSFAEIEQIALAKYTGKLRKGSASLGVTFGSWGQSSSMITARLGQASNALSNVYARLSKDRRRLRKVRSQKDPLANLILEGQFGWIPLIQDIRSAFRVIGGDTIPPVWITGRHRVDQTYNSFTPAESSPREARELYRGSAMVTVAASCSVSNPNAFLLNHLGVLNPLSVAWDLIPWSFVVGMFVNVQSMINSLTDEVGLEVKNKSTTRSCQTQYDVRLAYRVGGANGTVLATGQKSIKHRFRDRAVGYHPALEWRVHCPELNLGLMITAASLVMQRFQRINRLIAI